MEIPRCPNAVKGRGCDRSDVHLTGEHNDWWRFECGTCKLLWIVSKDGVQNRSKFENAAKRRREQEELNRRWEKRKKIFA